MNEPDPTSGVSPADILAYLRRRVRTRPPDWPSVSLPKPEVRPRLAEDPALGFLHAHWVLPDSPPPASGRGWRRALHDIGGRIVFSALRGYLAEERELLSRVVQVADTTMRRVDAIEADVRELADAIYAQLGELRAYVPQAVHGAGEEGASSPERAGGSGQEERGT